jgi:hypothetical protein
MSVNVFFIIGLGGLVGFLSGLFGVGGGFLLTPLLILAGIPPMVAAASDSNQIVAAASSGAYTHSRMGNVDLKMGIVLLLGGFTGGSIGVQIIKVLAAIGDNRSLEPKESSVRRLAMRLPWRLTFHKSHLTTSVIFPFLLGVLVGMLAAIMGVGGGFIMVPAMIYILGMPTIVAIGTDLFQIVLTCVNVTIQQAIRNHTVDLVLVVILFFGSTIGAQAGARVGRRLRGEQLRILLAVIVLVVMAMMVYNLVVAPDNLISISRGGGGH